MEFYVPTIGDKIYLTADWEFDLYNERRNQEVAVKLGIAEKTKTIRTYKYRGSDQIEKEGSYTLTQIDWKQGKTVRVKLPKGTGLVIDRIYIRGRGANREYDSITFRLAGSPDKKLAKGRFWVKLRDANTIQCSLHPVAPQINQSRFQQLEIE